MKNCNGCKYAQWKRTAAGKLHPSGNGQCSYKWKMPPLPAAMYFLSEPHTASVGHINRKEDWNEHCPYWAPAA